MGARERNVCGRASSDAGTKFSWPDIARETISAAVREDMLAICLIY